jgi:hypothetical protein
MSRIVRPNENGRREGARRVLRGTGTTGRRDQPPIEKVRTTLSSALSLPNTLSALLFVPT